MLGLNFNLDTSGYVHSEFCSMVRKIFIYTNEEVKRLSPKIKLPVSDHAKRCNPASDAAVGSEEQTSDVGFGH